MASKLLSLSQGESLPMGKKATTKSSLTVRDRGQPLKLYPKEIDGMTVYVPEKKKARELTGRYRARLKRKDKSID